jgi:hypothetical protein
MASEGRDQLMVSIALDNPSSLVPVPANIAVCPDCFGSLEAMPNEFERCGRTIDTYKVYMPTIYCQNNRQHGDNFTEADKDWFQTYEAVSDYFDTITVKFKFPIFYNEEAN